ncbi:helix-turn-helix domain-containing protein [Nocardioides hwasunensis]|uniref:Helix-turn-helix transcriptional regulator n=1 Tax=Nocardioides hwasunensis TaxID=397258 RepID=A0ABR8MJB3_9ACTN|nr:helix-turn-helix transcriptional regulator [Nocardioides hwasunensis]MBD3914835.1 helix-turn-helix transcriptional regulator [Nocardioides hwasunensis]
MGEILEFPAPAPAAPGERSEQPEPLWRELVGREVRRERVRRGERLVDVSGRAGVSTQYLSEVERGLKDPSSEMLQAIAGALDLSVRELATRVSAPTALALAA